MMRPLHALAAATVAAACLASPAAAQRIDSPYRFVDRSQQLGVFVGQLSGSEGQFGLGPESGLALGARWAIRVSGPLSVGVDLMYAPLQRTVRDTVFVAADSAFMAVGEADVGLLGLFGTVRFSLTGPRTWHGVQPYASLGAGAVTDLAGRPAVEEDLEPTAIFDFGTSFAGYFGAGAEWYATQRVSLRLDARNMMWRLRAPDAFLLMEQGRTADRARWENSILLSAGVSYHF
jgi:hypothetical protein